MEARLNNLRKYHFEKLDTIYSQGVITLANFFSDDSAKLNLLFFPIWVPSHQNLPTGNKVENTWAEIFHAEKCQSNSKLIKKILSLLSPKQKHTHTKTFFGQQLTGEQLVGIF